MKIELIGFVLLLIILIGCDRKCVKESSVNSVPDPNKEPFFNATLIDKEKEQIFIPKNLEEAHQELDRGLSEKAKEILIKDIKELPEEERNIAEGALGHFGIGLWMRNNWKLWKGGELAKHFNELGIFHPDDMSGIIIESYRAKLRNVEFPMNETVKSYQLYWKRVQKPDSIVDKETGNTIGIVDSATSYHLKDGRIIHVGEDKKTKEKWFYEVERGWYKPSTHEIEAIQNETKGVSKKVGKWY